MLKIRRARLERFFDSYNLDAILFTNLLNIRYLCGFSGSEGALLLSRDSAWFLCDSRYTTQADSEVGEAVIQQFTVKLDTVARRSRYQVAANGQKFLVNRPLETPSPVSVTVNWTGASNP